MFNRPEQLPNGLTFVRKRNNLEGSLFDEVEDLFKVDSQSFGFSDARALYTLGASACVVVILATEGFWGQYHGTYIRNEDKRANRGVKNDPKIWTLEQFMNFWRTGSIKPFSAVTLGANSGPVLRRQTLEVLEDYRPEQIIQKWNNVEDSFIDVMLDPQRSRIIQNLVT